MQLRKFYDEDVLCICEQINFDLELEREFMAPHAELGQLCKLDGHLLQLLDNVLHQINWVLIRHRTEVEGTLMNFNPNIVGGCFCARGRKAATLLGGRLLIVRVAAFGRCRSRRGLFLQLRWHLAGWAFLADGARIRQRICRGELGPWCVVLADLYFFCSACAATSLE